MSVCHQSLDSFAPKACLETEDHAEPVQTQEGSRGASHGFQQ